MEQKCGARFPLIPLLELVRNYRGSAESAAVYIICTLVAVLSEVDKLGTDLDHSHTRHELWISPAGAPIALAPSRYMRARVRLSRDFSIDFGWGMRAGPPSAKMRT